MKAENKTEKHGTFIHKMTDTGFYYIDAEIGTRFAFEGGFTPRILDITRAEAEKIRAEEVRLLLLEGH